MLSGELTARVNELFRSGATIRVRVPGKKSPQNFRVIMYLPETQRVHLHPLSLTAARSAVMPRGYPVNRLLESKPHLIDDPVRTSLMESAEEHIPMERRDARDQDWSLIAPLVQPLDIGLLSRKSRAHLVAKRAIETSVDKRKIQQLLSRFFYFGLKKNALLGTTERRGGPGQVRLNQPVRPGKQSAATILGRRPKGRGTSKRDIRFFLVGLRRYWAQRGMTLEDTYNAICRTLYRVHYVDASGAKRSSPVDPSHLPSIGQFLYRARQLLRQHPELSLSRFGVQDFENKVAASRGRASDVLAGPLDVVQTDATPFDFQLQEEGTTEKIGKACVYFAYLPGSSYVVGVYLSLEAECFDGYRRTLFISFTSKARLLAWLEIEGDAETLWPTMPMSNRWFVDRGPAKGEQAKQVAKSLNIEHTVAAAEDAEGKGGVESIQGVVQRQLSCAPGGYPQGKGRRQRKQRQDAIRVTNATRRALWKKIVDAILDHNKYANASKLLTAEMDDDGVKPNPEAIALWSKEHCADYLPIRDTKLLYLHLLPSEMRVLQRDGVHIRSGTYTSPLLKAHFLQTRTSKERAVRVYFDPVDATSTYWMTPNGTVDALCGDSETIRRNEGHDWESVELRRLATLSDLDEQRRNKIRKGFLRVEQEETLERYSGGHRANGRRKTSAAARERELARERAERKSETRSQMAAMTTPPSPNGGPSVQVTSAHPPHPNDELLALNQEFLKD